MRVEILRNLAEVRGFVEAWNGLLARVADHAFFARPEWHLAWWEAVAPDQGIRLVTVWSGESVVAVMPLCLSRGGAREGSSRMLEFSTRTQSDAHDVIVDPWFAPGAWSALRTAFAALASEADVIRLSHLRNAGAVLSGLGLAGRAYSTVQTHPVLALDAGTAARAKSGQRKDVRRQRRRLEGMGRLAMTRITGDGDAHEHIAMFLAMHREKWGADGDTRALRDPVAAHHQAFYRRAWDLLAPTGSVHFSMLTLDGEPIAYHFGFLHNRRFYFYKPTYAKSHEVYSPGKVHTGMLIDEAVASRCTEFDFLLGTESYKLAWGSELRHVETLVSQGARAPWSALNTWWVGRGLEHARGLVRRARARRAQARE